MGSPGAAQALTLLVLVLALFCSISITVAVSRTTWAFTPDDAIPEAKLWAKIHGPNLGIETDHSD
jgi:amino acid transporter